VEHFFFEPSRSLHRERPPVPELHPASSAEEPRRAHFAPPAHFADRHGPARADHKRLGLTEIDSAAMRTDGSLGPSRARPPARRPSDSYLSSPADLPFTEQPPIFAPC